MSTFPRTLIQIHYHDRPGGVVRVMRHYAQAFRSINAGGACQSFLVCAHGRGERHPEFPPASIKHLPEAGYREFGSIRQFLSARRRLIDHISAVLLSKKVAVPVAIVGHNLSLCKNAALVSAFAEISRRFRERAGEYRFFSVMHDCAEEGRVDQLRQIAALEARGIKIRRDISMTGGAVRHVTVSRKIVTAFSSAGIKVSFLQNPVAADTTVPVRRELFLHGLTSYCKKQRIPFNREKPIFAYPSRTIARKNPLEAIAFACIIQKGYLLLGPSGSTENDRRIHGDIKKLAGKYRLPVITDAPKIADVSYLYGLSDAAITTASAEGFGYGLFEPFLYGKPVMGRRPAGFRYPSGMTNKLLYDCLPVPAYWVSLASLKKRYLETGKACLIGPAGRRRFLKQIPELGGKGVIDFSVLDDASQIALVDAVLSSENLQRQWFDFLKKPRPGWPGLGAFEKEFPLSMIKRNRRIILRKFSMKLFVKEFKKCFSAVPAPSGPVSRDVLEKEFCDIRVFRIRPRPFSPGLLSPVLNRRAQEVN